MDIITVLDPIARLKETWGLKESTVQSLVARIRSGKPLNSRMIGQICNTEGEALSYDQVIPHIPREMLTPQIDALIRQATNDAQNEANPEMGHNAYGARVFR